MFHIEDYHYDIPEGLIAQIPSPKRDHSRLLLLERKGQRFSDHRFFDLPRLLKPGDLIVANDTRVIPARLFGHKESGGRVEVLVVEHPFFDKPVSNVRWCLVKASKRPRKGSRLFFERNMSGRIEAFGPDGMMKISFHGASSVDSLFEKNGHMPLPPYIKRGSGHDRSEIDKESYQTIYSQNRGAVAAPTAGLHFTEKLIKALAQSGVFMVFITLHVGHGTFRPVRTKDIRDHEIGEEVFIIDSRVADTINAARAEKRRIIAVGTTAVRALETACGEDGKIRSGGAKTRLMIIPGYRFKAINGLITNFHLPKSSLLFLVSALAGLETIQRAYQWAIEKRYRFFSYGDAMLIL
jgi:S-adenosylmethionine:tRNA ribosyltransferase-isomerase